jgi:carbonic anhydrase/SulP family sulfate permease
VIGLVLSTLFILHSNLRRPIRRILEQHIDGNLVHIELGNQVSFLNRASLERALRETPPGSRLLLDARRTDYIDPDVLGLIRDFRDKTAPVYRIQMQLIGFQQHYDFKHETLTVDYSSRESRETLTPDQVIAILREGNKRFVEGHPIDQGLRPAGVHSQPARAIAAIYTGIDAKTPVEILFDLGIGDAYVVRVPGILYSPRTLGGLEYAAVVGGVKAIVVLGRADSELLAFATSIFQQAPRATPAVQDCVNLDLVLNELFPAIAAADAVCPPTNSTAATDSAVQEPDYILRLGQSIISRTIRAMLTESPTLLRLVTEGQLKIVGAMVDSDRGQATFFAVTPEANKS